MSTTTCPPRCAKGYKCIKNVCVKQQTMPEAMSMPLASMSMLPNIELGVKKPSPPPIKKKTKKIVLVERTPSPIKVKTPSPIKVKVPSPKPIAKKKLTKKIVLVGRTPSPIKVKPSKVKTPSPIKVKTPSPIKVKTPSPKPISKPIAKKKLTKKIVLVERTPSPIKVKPTKEKTPSPIKVKTPIPIKVKTPSPIKVKTPIKEKTPSPIKEKTPIKEGIRNIRLIYKAKPYTGIMLDVSIVKNALNTYNIEEVNLIDKTQATKKHDKVYAQFFFEHVFMEDYEKTLPAEKSYLFVNHEWLYDWDMKAIRTGVIPLCKTILAYNLLASVKLNPKESLQSSQTSLQPSMASLQSSQTSLQPIYVGFGNNNPLPDFEYKIRGLAIHFAGASPTKGTFNLIKTWEKYIRKEGILIVSFTNDFNQHKQLLAFWDSLKPELNAELPGSILAHSTLLDYLNLTFERVGSLYLYKGSFDSLVKNYLQAAAQIHICPSIIEGWGHYIDEARRNKANVLVLDAPPMTELIFAYHVDEKGQKHLTKQCVPIYITGEFKNSISNAWTVYLQKEYPVLTYEPSKKEALADYIKDAFKIEKYKI